MGFGVERAFAHGVTKAAYFGDITYQLPVGFRYL